MLRRLKDAIPEYDMSAPTGSTAVEEPAPKIKGTRGGAKRKASASVSSSVNEHDQLIPPSENVETVSAPKTTSSSDKASAVNHDDTALVSARGLTNSKPMKPRNELSYKDKLQVLQMVKDKVPYSKIREEFNISKSSISRVKHSETLLTAIQNDEDINADQKRMKLNHCGIALDQKMFEWFKEMKNKNIHVPGKLIQEKAIEIAAEIGMADFKASNGWLYKFQNRHNIIINPKFAKAREEMLKFSNGEGEKFRRPPLREGETVSWQDAMQAWNTVKLWINQEYGGEFNNCFVQLDSILWRHNISEAEMNDAEKAKAEVSNANI